MMFYKTKVQSPVSLDPYQLGSKISELRYDALLQLFNQLNLNLEEREKEESTQGQKESVVELNALNELLKKVTLQTERIWNIYKPRIVDQIPIDIIEYVNDNTDENKEKVLLLLHEYCSQYDDFTFRLARCLLFLSKGSLEAINDIILYIHTPEELIITAEYEDKKWERNFIRPFGDEKVRKGDLDSIQIKFLGEDTDLPF